MAIETVAHLNFRGTAAQALAFYQSVFEGQLVAVTYSQAGAVQDPAEADQVMWGQVTAENGFAIMAYDVPSRLAWSAGENPFFVSVRGDAEDEIRGFWDKLSRGSAIVQPLAPAAWSPLYGMLKDRFGVTWVLDVATHYAGA
ncbi:Glyoxalase/bleomycin resistance protein/dioxygenase [Alloalcanivorax dieselolei B5]|uniref:Glyoxalase/bleomycin resistance protein/dioxygenase n=1 Tax=Alcanivorax dieselolei (strain DSM 16502 / CGMCC 1.3690 / MCCC 1A00001 / B-5) TaxID=930169 RepID=K0CF93_ALCDB|nr:VOC family protein [Alloalcanivorax dieselolei]AFT71045.1 Glyoxalase/bleomycin resistance protein/dioxygenase [Alloalcanivorax dieselolei B5]GGK00523.1 VOC family protein [Alloalcanivorax dieselolei]